MTIEIAAIIAAIGLALVILAVVINRRQRGTARDRANPQKRNRKVQTFFARDHSGGRVVLDVFQEFIDAGTRGDPTGQRKGAKQIMTGDGRRVEKIGTRKYRVAGTTEILTSDDPGAP
ncbi:MAG: hypothetical protein ACT4P8_19525 [Betaproteobacteria bacterium]